MKTVHLSQTSPNMSSIGEVCNILGKTFLTSLVGNHWATGRLRLNLSSVKGGLIIFPLLLLEGNAILPMTPKAHCVVHMLRQCNDQWQIADGSILLGGLLPTEILGLIHRFVVGRFQHFSSPYIFQHTFFCLLPIGQFYAGGRSGLSLPANRSTPQSRKITHQGQGLSFIHTQCFMCYN